MCLFLIYSFEKRNGLILMFIFAADHSQGLVIVGVVLALAAVVAMVMAAVWLVRTKALLGRKSSGGVAFENPSYLREVNMDHIQVSSKTRFL